MWSFLKDIINFIYPKRCVICKKIIRDKNNAAICLSCLNKLPFINDKGCKKCGKPKTTSMPLCNDCARNNHSFNRCISVFEYKEPVKKAIIYFKAKGYREYAKTFAALMADVYKKSKLPKPDIIIPVPMFKQKKKEKGFNHSFLLAKYIADIMNVKVLDDIIIKRQNTAGQKNLNRQLRMNNIKGAFKVLDKKSIKNKKILIVDDIYTTGATADECSKELIQAGALRVNVLVLASGVGY